MLGLLALASAPGGLALEHSISGHVNRVVRFADDGEGSDPHTFFIKGGYRRGNNAASIGWSTVRDLTAGVDSDRLTFGVVHTLTDLVAP